MQALQRPGQTCKCVAQNAPVQRALARRFIHAGDNALASKQRREIRQFMLVRCRPCPRRGAFASQHALHNARPRHGRNEGAIVAFGQQMPGADGFAAIRPRARHFDKHAAAMLTPA